VLGVSLLALLGIFWRDASAMAVIWWTSSTYGHCLFILPIIFWLIRQRWPEIRGMEPKSWLPGLAFVALGAIGWVLGEAATVGLVRHASLIVMIQSAILTILGPAIFRALLFPIFYLIFLIPFGEEMVPVLQTFTAKMCMILLGWTGVPAHIEGVFISIPNGYFKVAEACSGVKFLVAMIAYGMLVANVCYKSWPRRIAFLAMAVIVPVLANGVRAFGTIYISHLTDTNFAAGFDHVVYGWFFFALVMALVMGLGWTFFDRKLGDRWLVALPDNVKGAGIRPQLAAAFALLIALVGTVWETVVIPQGRAAMPHSVALPEVPGWTRVPIRQHYLWSPNYAHGDHYLMAAYRNGEGQQVDFAMVLFAWQDEGKKILGYGQGPYDPDSKWAWANDTVAPQNGKAARIIVPGPVEREVASFFVLGGHTTASARSIKFETLKSRLIGGDQSAVAVLVSAENQPLGAGRPAIDSFLSALGPVDQLATKAVSAARGS
jgi:exosortase A